MERVSTHPGALLLPGGGAEPVTFVVERGTRVRVLVEGGQEAAFWVLGDPLVVEWHGKHTNTFSVYEADDLVGEFRSANPDLLWEALAAHFDASPDVLRLPEPEAPKSRWRSALSFRRRERSEKSTPEDEHEVPEEDGESPEPVVVEELSEVDADPQFEEPTSVEELEPEPEAADAPDEEDPDDPLSVVKRAIEELKTQFETAPDDEEPAVEPDSEEVESESPEETEAIEELVEPVGSVDETLRPTPAGTPLLKRISKPDWLRRPQWKPRMPQLSRPEWLRKPGWLRREVFDSAWDRLRTVFEKLPELPERPDWLRLPEWPATVWRNIGIGIGSLVILLAGVFWLGGSDDEQDGPSAAEDTVAPATTTPEAGFTALLEAELEGTDFLVTGQSASARQDRLRSMNDLAVAMCSGLTSGRSIDAVRAEAVQAESIGETAFDSAIPGFVDTVLQGATTYLCPEWRSEAPASPLVEDGDTEVVVQQSVEASLGVPMPDEVAGFVRGFTSRLLQDAFCDELRRLGAPERAGRQFDHEERLAEAFASAEEFPAAAAYAESAIPRATPVDSLYLMVTDISVAYLETVGCADYAGPFADGARDLLPPS